MGGCQGWSESSLGAHLIVIVYGLSDSDSDMTDYQYFILTQMSRVNFSILIDWASPISILGESGMNFNFCLIFFNEIPVSKHNRPR